ncbi:MAG: membrane protein insertion efficiency factor YidD [Actinomycetia bacterium]|nr:membrane protein insertion efficiency factor YidD [Actinomycetes bacterium]
MRIVRGIALVLLRIYTWVLRPLLRMTIPEGGCLYYPTCSAYATDAFRAHHPVRAFLLTAWRLLRCHPFARGGYDPVPQAHNIKCSPHHPERR